MKIAAPLFIASIALTACAPARIAPPRMGNESVRAEFLEPKVGEVSKREVGESLVRRGISTTTRSTTVTLLDDASSSMDLGHKLVAPAGTTGILQRRSDNDLPVVCLNTGGAGIVVTGRAVGCLVDIDGDGRFDQSMFAERDRYFPLAAPVRYKLDSTNQAVENPLDFHVDVLYQGISRGEVKISYREFKGGVARPAFTQDVAYELDTDGSGMIAFKGMRIKVLKATREHVTYIVEKPPTN